MTKDVLVSDELRRRIVGLKFPPATIEVEKGHVLRFAEAIGDPNPLWSDEVAARKSRYGGIIAPPTFLRVLRGVHLLASLDLPGVAGLDGGSEWEYFEPVRVGDRVTASYRVESLNERQGQTGPLIFVVTSVSYTNQLSQCVASQRITTIRFGAPRVRPLSRPSRSARSRQSEEADGKVAHMPYTGLQIGQGISSLIKHPSTQDLVKWAGASGDFAPIHFDKDHAIKSGLPGVIIHGALKCSWFGQAVTDWIGERGTLRKLRVRYRGMDVPGDSLTIKGRVGRVAADSSATSVDLELSLEDGSGRITTQGEAMVEFPVQVRERSPVS